MVVLAQMESCHLPAAEMHAINYFGTLSPSGYNMTPGGETPPSLVPEIAAKIGAKLIGKKISDETRAKRSASLTGRVFTETHRARLAAAQTGKTYSAESRAKMSLAAKAKFAKRKETHI
jgi:hypothetical protein